MVYNVRVTDTNRFGKKLSLDQMMRSFKKKCEKANVLQDMRKHEYYVAPSLKRKLKSKEARKRVERENAKKQAMLEKINKDKQ